MEQKDRDRVGVSAEERRHSLIARALRQLLTTDELVWRGGERVNVADAIVYLANVVDRGLADIAKAVRQQAPAQWATEEEQRDHLRY